MKNQPQPQKKKESVLQQYSMARGNLLLMIALTVVNIILFAIGSETMLLFSATVPYYAVVFGVVLEIQEFLIAGYVIAGVLLLLYLLCWIFSKKNYGWMIAALVLFIIDTAALILLYVWLEDFSGILDALIHIWVLYYLIVGVRYGHRLHNISPEDEVDFALSDEQHFEATEPITTSTALRPADTDIKFRVLIEGDYIGHHITYRRVKRVNELVIDGFVYDAVEMMIENAHNLNAVIDGHTVQVGFDGISAYICIDGERVAKKLRLV